jgi:3-oxoacyl-[acyl-carrier protein] reductase
MKRFSQQHALITGAGQGIGYAIALALSQEGASITLNDLDAARAQTAVQQINESVQREAAIASAGDISQPSFVAEMIEKARERSPLHILVANAGITEYGPFLDCQPAAFDRLTQVNLRGSFFSAQSAAKAMIQDQVAGRIILMSSVTGVQAHKNLSAYGMTKAAIRMMARSLALVLGPHGITVNALGPGATLTERTLELDAAYEQGWNAVAPNRRTARTEDVTAACLFLASPEARHITGETLMVDGGWTVHSPLPGESYQ